MEDLYKAIVEILQKGGRAAVATIVSTRGSTPAPVGSKILVLSDGLFLGTVGGGGIEAKICDIAKEVMEESKLRIVSFDLKHDDSICGGSMDVFIEPVVPLEKLYIFGAGHIGQPLGKMAAMAGFNVIIVDDRDIYANKNRFPEASEIIVSDFENALQKLEPDINSYIVIVTRGHAYDRLVLEWACGTKAKYIGMIGSKAKVKSVFDELRQKGIEQKLASIHAPIGLDIGSETPSEIAVSILAEMIQERHK